MFLELGEGHFDRIEVGAIWGQEDEPGAACLEDRLGLCAFVAGEIVEDDHVTPLERGGELGLDIGLEDTPVHGAVNHPGCGQAVVTQPRDKGLCTPMTERGFHLEPLPSARPAPQSRHLGGCPGFIEKNQPSRAFLHPGLAMVLPDLPSTHDVSAIGFAGQQSFF